MRITDQQMQQRYYQALLDKDPSYVGIFYAGVKTTSVFCIASCRARKPKPENVEFFTHYKDALDHGYRPCKICRPTENACQAPPAVAQAIDMVRNAEKTKVTDEQLRQRGIGPETVRRWFKKHYGMTFQTFQRMYRINQALEELKHGRAVIDSAYETGYQSLSGFGYTYKKLVGQKPSVSAETQPILLDRLTTPLGPMLLGATEKGVCLLEFVDRRMLETEFRDLQRLLKAPVMLGENDHIRQAKTELEEYFAGVRREFSIALDMPGTDFQQQVWQGLQTIPYAQTRSYKAQADYLGRPTAVRAVANANGYNRVAIVVPCHRVIGSNGNLTGYGGGLERKRWLLEHERNQVN
ncbi:XRE family transcriptional regulator [Aliidiomarina sedimenti]|uniref:Methylated-DNA--protein-cysteine methyltransferase n=1 Tax=Aliidiomarina sedimenti TaxID=1933879 RepID=A0ABY0BYJ8_9GAMM|nr:methylated-DNA--[protein]-cysteine S-methyltransferase [Aliidiomarina sedimenti]RUO29768.1 XRE family transcriptional regulator [Aliidiomarina sedimenti]